MSFDALRRRHPDFGFAAYCLDPAGPVVLEVHSFGQVAAFEGPSLASCIVKAFPPVPSANVLTPLPPAPPKLSEPIDAGELPAFLRREPTPPKPPAADSVFD